MVLLSTRGCAHLPTIAAASANSSLQRNARSPLTLHGRLIPMTGSTSPNACDGPRDDAPRARSRSACLLEKHMIRTTEALRKKHRLLETRMKSARIVLELMRAGAALHLQFTRSGPIWTLTTGQRVADDVAKLVISSSSVVDCGDALFRGTAAQTFQWWDEE